jgi:hypothetical protein
MLCVRLALFVTQGGNSVVDDGVRAACEKNRCDQNVSAHRDLRSRGACIEWTIDQVRAHASIPIVCHTAEKSGCRIARDLSGEYTQLF